MLFIIVLIQEEKSQENRTKNKRSNSIFVDNSVTNSPNKL